MDKDIENFIEKFSSEIKEGNAAIFAGAGLSVAAGFADWKKLLEPIAIELGLKIDKEHDLISLAQYHCNEKNSRHDLNQLLIDKFCESHKITDNHMILARLPITTYWTTNYDQLIENSLKEETKIVDVKYTLKQLTNTKKNRKAILYKMHGDMEHPDEAILTKDDYEMYFQKNAPFVTALSGDLVSKTFLFLGFSFSDPNLDYILSRVRINLQGKNLRTHYCIFKKERKSYTALKQQLIIKDLKRFNIQTLLVDNYSDITLILQKIENRFRKNTIFISGSAHIYGDHGKEKSEFFMKSLSQELIRSNYKIVSGFGLGVGSHIIMGALEEIYEKQSRHLEDQLLLRPFPQGEAAQKQWEKYRKDMISYAGIAIFVFGNKTQNGQCLLADGIRKEFDIAKEKKLLLIPVGATGFMAKKIWEEMLGNFDQFYPNATKNLKILFQSLGNESMELLEHIATITKIINQLKGEIYYGT